MKTFIWTQTNSRRSLNRSITVWQVVRNVPKLVVPRCVFQYTDPFMLVKQKLVGRGLLKTTRDEAHFHELTDGE